MDHEAGRVATAAELDELEKRLATVHSQTNRDAAAAIAALRRERDEARAREQQWAVTEAELRSEYQAEIAALRAANAQMAAALRELHEAVKAVAPHFEAPVTSENVGLWQRLDAAQKTAATLPAPEQEPFGADVGRERLDEPASLRDAVIEECAKVAELAWTASPDEIAAAIRALAAKGGDHDR
jgi:hypothetical protein